MENSYEQITPAEAKEIMDNENSYVILDVRTQEEFDEAHMDGAILIPDYEIAEVYTKIKNNFEVTKNRIQLYCNQVFVTDSVEGVVPYQSAYRGIPFM